MRLSMLAAAALAAAVVLAGSRAQADPAQGFGDSGQLAISSDMQLSFIGETVSPAQGSGSSGSQIVLAPAADFFVIPNLSVGGQLFFEFISPAAPNSSTTVGWGVGPRVGYDLAFAENFSVWPRAYFLFEALSTSSGAGASSVGTLGLFAPVLWHPIPHFFIGLGPFAQTDLLSKVAPPGGSSTTGSKTTEYGVLSTIGGWFLGGD
jgi:hypothetical protein